MAKNKTVLETGKTGIGGTFSGINLMDIATGKHKKSKAGRHVVRLSEHMKCSNNHRFRRNDKAFYDGKVYYCPTCGKQLKRH